MERLKFVFRRIGRTMNYIDKLYPLCDDCPLGEDCTKCEVYESGRYKYHKSASQDHEGQLKKEIKNDGRIEWSDGK